jgi:hypothetical protein
VFALVAVVMSIAAAAWLESLDLAKSWRFCGEMLVAFALFTFLFGAANPILAFALAAVLVTGIWVVSGGIRLRWK